DFQCPYCAGLQSTLQDVLKAFPRDVRLVYKQYPLNIHQYAQQAALASVAAHQQGKFWVMHDKLSQTFQAINDENIKKWADEAGRQKAPASPRAAPATKAQAGAGRPGGH